MAREKERDRVYRKGERFYADFRDYADVGGALTALIPTGQRMATKNRDEANIVATEHLRRLEAARHGRAFGGVTSVTTLAEASMAYLVHSAGRSNAPGETWLAQCERHLRAACLVLDDARDPSTIRVTDVEAFDTYLATTALILPGIEGRRGRTPLCGLDSGTRRHYLNTLSKLFKWMGKRGMVLAAPNSMKPHTDFEAEVYVLTKEEGGRHTPFFNNYRPQFYFRTTDVTGAVELPKDKEMVMPGDNVSITVKLINPIAMEEGLRFAIREGGRTVGSGVVAKIME